MYDQVPPWLTLVWSARTIDARIPIRQAENEDGGGFSGAFYPKIARWNGFTQFWKPILVFLFVWYDQWLPIVTCALPQEKHFVLNVQMFFL